MASIPYYQVDVFSSVPLSGNGLTIFPESDHYSPELMLSLTREMRQFESIFLQTVDDTTFKARIFTCEEELAFAGHPILGAAALLHDLHKPGEKQGRWVFELKARTVTVTTIRHAKNYEAIMNQGAAEFGKELSESETDSFLELIGASPDDLYPGCKPQLVSTGLPYLILPVRANDFRFRFGAPGLDEKLQSIGAKFLGLLEIDSRSIRTGSNDGTVEDIATGSLAGPAAAYLVKQGFEESETEIRLHQGKNLNRKSELFAKLRSTANGSGEVLVSGYVCKVGRGWLELELDLV